jgi:hypothetical protein
VASIDLALGRQTSGRSRRSDPPVMNQRFSVGTPRVLVAALLCVASAAVALRLFALGRHGLWQDEVSSVYLAKDLSRVADPLMGHAPLYYVLLSAWAGLGTSESWIRGLSVLLGLAAILVLFCIVAREFSVGAALIAAWLTAVSPVAIWASREARAYILLHLLALLGFWALLRARETGSATLWALYGVCAAAAAYTHYYAVFLLASFGLVALLPSPVPPWKNVLGYGLASSLALLLFAPWLPVLVAGRQGLAGYAAEVNRFATANSHPAKSLLYLWARSDPPGMLGAAAEALVPGRSFTWLSLLGLCVLLACTMRSARAEPGRSALLPWLVAGLVPTALAVASHYLGNVIIGSRYVAFSGLFLAVPLAVLLSGGGRLLVWGGVLGSLCLGVAGVQPLYDRPGSQLREAVFYIDEKAKVGDCVATVSNKAFCYRFYSRRPLPVIDLPWQVPGIERVVSPATPLADRAIRPSDLPAILASFRRCSTTWVLFNEEYVWGVDMGGGRLRAALREGGFDLRAAYNTSDTRVEAYRVEQ